MSDIRIESIPCHTFGEMPKVGELAPEFEATAMDLTMVSLSNFTGKPLLINVYPCIDTGICHQSVLKFDHAFKDRPDVNVLCISMDLPFRLTRIAEGEGIHPNVLLLSDFRNREFGDTYGLTIADGPLAGLLARALLVLDSAHQIVHTELAEDISKPVNYEKALQALN